MQKEIKNKNVYFLIGLAIISVFSIASFGTHVLLMNLVAIGIAFFVEIIFSYFRKKEPKILNWFFTPMIFVLFLPAAAPLWLVLWGTVFSVLFGKAVFGGDDNYVFHPALVGMLFVTISFPQQLNNEWVDPIKGLVGSNNTAELFKNGQLFNVYSYKDLFLGNSAGAIGEVFRLGILIIGLLFIVFKVIDWKVPTFFLITYFALNVFGNMQNGNFNIVDSFTPLLVGSVLFTAFFVAVDEPTQAKYPIGKIIYGVGFGFFTYLLRTYSSFSDALIFVVVLMNTLAPLIDKIEEAKYEVNLEEVEEGVSA